MYVQKNGLTRRRNGAILYDIIRYTESSVIIIIIIIDLLVQNVH